jgi:hypothetical protein
MNFRVQVVFNFNSVWKNLVKFITWNIISPHTRTKQSYKAVETDRLSFEKGQNNFIPRKGHIISVLEFQRVIEYLSKG